MLKGQSVDMEAMQLCFLVLKGQSVGMEAMQLCIILLPMKYYDKIYSIIVHA